MKILVLGAGRVGNTMARDLAKDGEYQVAVADLSEAALDRLADAPSIQTLRADLSDPTQLAQVVAPFDLVVGAVPGSIGFATVKATIECGKNIVDISFFEEDPFLLDDLAKRMGATAVVDIGIAPGCGNIILGYLETVLDKVETYTCLAGGLPVVRTWPYEYKAVFSPSDVLEEYVRPARFVAHGEVVTLPALSEPELVDFPGVGSLEAFNTDGLRTLLTTSKVPFMKERTLRYPGHIEKMRMLRETGFFSKEPVDVGGAKVRPVDLTSKLMFRMWQLADDEEDLTAVRVTVEGEKDGKRIRYDYELLDRYDPATATTSMARTTGFTCTAAARLVARGAYRRPGISPPEFLGRESTCHLFVMQELAKRGVVFRQSVE